MHSVRQRRLPEERGGGWSLCQNSDWIYDVTRPDIFGEGRIETHRDEAEQLVARPSRRIPEQVCPVVCVKGID